MLRRQQAQAIIAARKKIVNGVVKLDDHGLTTMVNNLMLALVSEHYVQPVMSAAQP